MEIMTWVPSYNQAIWKAALSANTGGTWNPRNTLTRIGGQMWQVQSNGTLVQGVPDADVQWVRDFSNANGIKFLICTHNYTSNWDWPVARSAFVNNRTALVNNLVNVVNQWGAAGVDIDFEGNLAGDPDRAEFATFIRELGTRLHANGKELTVDIFPYIWNQPNMNWIGRLGRLRRRCELDGLRRALRRRSELAGLSLAAGHRARRRLQDLSVPDGHAGLDRRLGLGRPGHEHARARERAELRQLQPVPRRSPSGTASSTARAGSPPMSGTACIRCG